MTHASDNDPRFVSTEQLAARRATPGQTTVPTSERFLVPVHGTDTITFQGKDTLRYLQSKLTTDTRKWQASGGGFAYATDINGRIVGGGHFSMMPSGAVALYVDPGQTDALAAHFDKYIIMEDVTITRHHSKAAWLLMDADATADGSELTYGVHDQPAYATHEDAGVYAVCLQRSLQPATLLTGDEEAVASAVRVLTDAGTPVVTWDAWRAREIEQGFVRPGFELALGETIPLEVGPDHGVEYNKGCYLGQEVIERLRSRGTPNREFRRVTWVGPGAPALTGLVDAEGKDVGSLASASSDGDRHHAIASLRRRALTGEGEVHVASPEGSALTIVGPAV